MGIIVKGVIINETWLNNSNIILKSPKKKFIIDSLLNDDAFYYPIQY